MNSEERKYLDAALILAVAALIVALIIWAINSPLSPFYEQYNDVGIGTYDLCASNISQGIFVMNNSSVVDIGDVIWMNETERTEWRRTKQQEIPNWKL